MQGASNVDARPVPSPPPSSLPDSPPDSPPDSSVLERLHATIERRRGADPETSYTARLLAGGPVAVARKLGEEGVEAALATACADRSGIVAESADLLYHLLVAWAAGGVAPSEVWRELARREGVSGIEEKRARNAAGKG